MTGVAPWAAVVVNFEAGDHLLACVRSLLADRSAGDAPDVVVVDNASADDSLATLQAALPGVRVVPAGGNLGYARAANRGIAATVAPVVAVVNPDAVVHPGTAGALVGRLGAEPDLGAVGPRILSVDGSTYPSARAEPSPVDAAGHAVLGLLWRTNPWSRRYRQLDADPDRPRDADWVSGAAVWLRRRALDQVGGWDERYFMFLEDLDLCRRLRAAGWRVAYEPGGVVTHVEGVSRARRPYRMIVEHHRSTARFARDRYTGRRRILLPAALALVWLRAAVALGARALTRSGPGRRRG